MTKSERADVKALIRFYDQRGWDWGLAAEFLLRKLNLSAPYCVIRTTIGVGRGRPRRKQ
jgi:hypothetical protein